MLEMIYAHLRELGFEGVAVLLIQVALLFLLAVELIQFIHFVLKKKK